MQTPEAVLAAYVAAWNAHDMKAFANLFSEDADYVNAYGEWWQGREALQAKNSEAHGSYYARTRMRMENPAVRALGNDLALVQARWVLHGDTRARRDERLGFVTLVLTKAESRWRIRLAQNTERQQPAPKETDAPSGETPSGETASGEAAQAR